MGLQLVTLLTEQLEGALELRKNGGTEFVISFPIVHSVAIKTGGHR